MIIDFHTHVFPDAIAQRASGNIAKFYDMPTAYDGTLSTLLKIGGQSGLGGYVVHSVATRPSQVAAINDFIAGICRENSNVWGFAALHPDQRDMADEIDRALGMGLKGVKIHSDMQRVALDDPRLMKLYGLIEGRVPILLHAGDRRFDYSNPDRLVRVLDAFPRLAVVGAHFGGWSVWQKAAQALSGRDLYVDCSSSMYALTPEEIRALVRGYGAHRVLFGSDYPMWNPGREIERLRAAGLEKAEMELILHENARRLLGV